MTAKEAFDAVTREMDVMVKTFDAKFEAGMGPGWAERSWTWGNETITLRYEGEL